MEQGAQNELMTVSVVQPRTGQDIKDEGTYRLEIEELGGRVLMPREAEAGQLSHHVVAEGEQLDLDEVSSSTGITKQRADLPWGVGGAARSVERLCNGCEI